LQKKNQESKKKPRKQKKRKTWIVFLKANFYTLYYVCHFSLQELIGNEAALNQ
jgi:hypothetical protein